MQSPQESPKVTPPREVSVPGYFPGVETDISPIAGALWKIRRTPFLGKLLAGSGLGMRGALLCIALLAASFLFLPGAMAVLALETGMVDRSFTILSLLLMPLSWGVILLLIVSAWGVFQLQRELSKASLGDFESWMQSFFGPRSRIPLQMPETAERRIKALGAVLLALLLGIAGVTILAMGLALVSLPLIIIAAAVITLHLIANRWFRRLVAVPSSKILINDKRAPVLFLRSFNDDGLAFKPGFFSLTFGNSFRFEEKLAANAWREGPVVAIGKPGEKLPEWGACREYHSDDTWQQRILDLMDQAGGICMLVGITDALGWEIHQIQKNGSLSKSVFIIPPLPVPEVAKRLMKFSTLLTDFDVEAVNPSVFGSLLCVIFDDQCKPIAFTSARRNAGAYNIAMHAAFVRLGFSRAQRLPETYCGEAISSRGKVTRGQLATRFALLALPVLTAMSLAYSTVRQDEWASVAANGEQPWADLAADNPKDPAVKINKTWTGKARPYLMSAPESWTLNTENPQFDTFLVGPFGAAACWMAVEDNPDPSQSVTTPAEMVEIVEILLAFGDATEIEVEPLDAWESGGNRWLRTRSRATVNGFPFIYLHSICWREDAVYTMVALALEFRFEEFQSDLLKVLNDVKLPE
jgi:hypothetical protein